MTQFITRAYNTIEHLEDEDLIVKSSKEDRLADEITYYENMPYHLRRYFPEFCGSSYIDGTHKLYLQYHPFENLGKLMCSSNFDNKNWDIILTNIINMLNDFEYNNSIPFNSDAHYAMYIQKTESEYLKLRTHTKAFHDLTNYEKLIINDEECYNFGALTSTLWHRILQHMKMGEFCIIHGDLCFSNIIYDPITFDLKVLDPRGSFGPVSCYGDPSYDLAKILHSCEGGYEYFINDKFTVDVNENVIDLHYHGGQKHKIHKVVLDAFADWDIENARLIEGLIFIGMCARHYDSLDRQLAMYATGIKILNDVLKNVIKKGE